MCPLYVQGLLQIIMLLITSKMGRPGRGDYTPKKRLWKIRFLKMGRHGRGDYTPIKGL